MQGINTIVLVGRLTADPVLRKTQSNKSVASFSVAVDRRTAQGAEQSSDFIPCVVWNAIADNVAKYLNKGSMVGVTGRLQSRKYTDKQGNNRVAYEVVCDNVRFLEVKKTGNTAAEFDGSGYEPDPVPEEPEGYNDGNIEVSSDDLPF